MRSRAVVVLAVLAGGGLAACSPVPDSGAPVGQDLNTFRSGALRTGAPRAGVAVLRPPATPPAVAPERPVRAAPAAMSAPDPGPDPARARAEAAARQRAEEQRRAQAEARRRTQAEAEARAQATARAEAQRVAAAQAAPVQPVAQPAASAQPAPAAPRQGLSDEQDFAAVAARRSIEEDAARLAAQRGRFQMVDAAPVQAEGAVPSIVGYALAQARPVGAGGYARSPFAAKGRHARACAGFRTPDVAQEQFLAAGGPQKDRLGLDPDGDGNACAWNPETYKRLMGG